MENVGGMMKDYTRSARGTRRKRKEVREGLIAFLVGIEFILAFLGAAHFESTDDPKGIIIAAAAMLASLVVVIVINIREERD
jgi:SNF family Na+-dependent transporter